MRVTGDAIPFAACSETTTAYRGQERWLNSVGGSGLGQAAGGWASPMMPLRSIETAMVANERVQLGKKPMSARE
jgi:hypothetical protein